MMDFARFPIVCVVVVLFASHTAATVPLGVAEEDAAAFTNEAGIFACRSSDPASAPKTVLQLSWVNDDFCDCPDGSDEPGTSACSAYHASAFYCRNEHFEGRHVASSRVNDGICDCCDGTDEKPGVCQDTCVEEARIANDVNRAQREMRLKGARERSRAVVTAQEGLQEEREGLDKARKLLADAATGKVHAEEKTAAGEAKEAAERAALLLSAHHNAEVRLGLHLLSHEQLRAMVVRLVREDLDATAKILALSEELRDIDCNSTEVGCAPPVLAQDAAALAEANEAAQAAKAEEQQVAQAGTNGEENHDDMLNDEAEEIELDEPSGDEDEEEAVATARRVQQTIVDEFVSAEQFVLAEAESLRETLDTLEKSVAALEKAAAEKEEVVEKTDFGADNVWYAIRDACFDTSLHGYTWKFCPLKNMKQDSVSLGNFVRWENDYATMIFEGGSRCWNGPERSVQIDLECGAESELLAVEEPSKCVYKGRFATPLMCTEVDTTT